MKAGLFECDHVDARYRTQFGDYSEMFAQLFPEMEWTHYDVCNGHFPEDLDACEVYFATGSRRSVYEDEPWIIRVKDVIKELASKDKHFVGFCFGHQLLGEAMGGAVRKAPTGWCVGVHQFEVVQQEAWMQPYQAQLNLLMMCQDQVVELPANSTILASSSQCPAGMFQVGERMLGVQAHPEFSKAYDRLLMEKRRDRMGEEVVGKGIQTLSQEVHRAVIRAWVLRFLGYNTG